MTQNNIDRTLAVAPMMKWTDRHCRYFHRLLCPNALLYTEMITTGALIYGDRDRLLQYNAAEQPLALQLGGCEPKAMATCARMAEDAGFAEVNINVGCPSDRVKSGQFGLVLLHHAKTVASCVQAMKQAVKIPITVKTRTGVDHQDSLEHLQNFVQQQLQAGADHICIHARKGWLQGLSPKQNRTVPELNYQRVYQIKQLYPQASIGINGGITTLPAITEHLQHVDSVMLGRIAYQNPYILAQAYHQCLGGTYLPTRLSAVKAMVEYCRHEIANNNTQLKQVTRHMLGLFHGQAGGKRWRRILSTQAHLPGASPDLLLQALPG